MLLGKEFGIGRETELPINHLHNALRGGENAVVHRAERFVDHADDGAVRFADLVRRKRLRAERAREQHGQKDCKESVRFFHGNSSVSK